MVAQVDATAAIWRTDKDVALTGHTRHRHKPSPVSPGFSAPTISGNLTFGPTALAASIARTSTLCDAPPEMLARWRDSELTRVEWLVADGAVFSLSSYVNCLADSERTSFAGHVGAGITDILMNALGYTWRDNAACLSGSLDPHADFIYGGGRVSGHGVVLAEAHGSFAANVSTARMGTRAKNKYSRQVKPYVATMSPHGKIAHGYSIAFGSKPGAAGAFLNVAETMISKPRGTAGPPAASEPVIDSEAVPTPLVLAAHRSNFVIMDAPRVVTWIDWVRTGGEFPYDVSEVGFLRLPYAGRTFLACVDALWPFDEFPFYLDGISHELRWWPHFRGRRLLRRSNQDDFAGWFVMEENAAERFLNSLSAMIRNGRERIPGELELPVVETVGFRLGQESSDAVAPAAEYAYALYRDGLALIGSPPPRRTIGHRTWSPKDGMDTI